MYVSNNQKLCNFKHTNMFTYFQVPMKIKFQKPFSKYEKYPLTAIKYQKLNKNENMKRKYYFDLPQQNSISFN